MTRLIDADALLKAISAYPYGYRGMITCEIENQPTVDAEPVRHGTWIYTPTEQLGYRCSVCGKGCCRFNYCPNCGARMDAE